jgi:hypothetical protein
VLFVNRNSLARTRVSALACIAFLDRKRPKTTQLNPVTPRHGINDFFKDRIRDFLNVALVKVRIFISNLLDQFAPDHVAAPLVYLLSP